MQACSAEVKGICAALLHPAGAALDRLRWLPESAQERLAHAFAVTETGFPRNHLDRMPGRFHHQPGRFHTHPLDRFGRELARFDVKDYAAADKLARETLDSIEQILRQRPSHIAAVRIRDSITLLRAHYGLEQRRVAPSLAILDGQLAIGEARLQTEPGSVAIRDGLAIFLGTRINALVRLGRIADANAAHERQMRLYDGAQPGPYQVSNLLLYAEDIGTVHAELGDSAQLQGLLEQMNGWNAIRRKAAAPETAAIYDIDIASTTFNLKAIAGDASATIAAADALIASSLDKLASAKDKGDECATGVVASIIILWVMPGGEEPGSSGVRFFNTCPIRLG